MISKNLDDMILKMEQSTDEDQAVAASCLRIDVKRWAETHACYRCPKASWMATPTLAGPVRPGQPAPKFKWDIGLGACSAFMPVLMDNLPKGSFFCSVNKQEQADGGFSLAAGERQGGTGAGAGWGNGVIETPRQRGQGEGQ